MVVAAAPVGITWRGDGEATATTRQRRGNRSCRHRHCPFHGPQTSPTLVAVLRRHRHRSPATIVAVAIATSSPATLITVAIALATLTLALFVSRQPCHRRHQPRRRRCRHHRHRPCRLVAVNCLPPSLPSLLPPKPSISSLHSTFVTKARHPPPLSPLPSLCHRHPFGHMLPSLVDCFVLTFNVG